MLLSVPERLLLLNVLSRAEGNLVTLRVVRDLQTLVGFDEDELKALDFQWDGEMTRWNPAADVEREFAISPTTQKTVAGVFKRLDAKEQLTMQHLPVYEKFLEDSPKE